MICISVVLQQLPSSGGLLVDHLLLCCMARKNRPPNGCSILRAGAQIHPITAGLQPPTRSLLTNYERTLWGKSRQRECYDWGHSLKGSAPNKKNVLCESFEYTGIKEKKLNTGRRINILFRFGIQLVKMVYPDIFPYQFQIYVKKRHRAVHGD